MADLHPQKYGLVAIGLVLCLLAASPKLRAQQEPAPTLDDILARLESNLHTYEATVPSFFCDEHVVSQVVPSVGNQDTVSDGIFRLKRITNPDNSISLDESRQIRTVNGKPANADDLNGPVVLKGAFSGGLAIVSLSQKACMRYSLRPIKPGHPDAPYIVQFESLYDSRHPARCLLQEEGSGRVYIDPHTMQITHIELTAPHHILFQSSPSAIGRVGSNPTPVLGNWTVSVDYAPVPLGGRTFWMPSAIESTASNQNVPGAILSLWSFKAKYRNYHKLEVTSRIVPPEDASPQ
jgi:hypothetical protein